MSELRVLIVDDEEEFTSTLVERLLLREIDCVGVTSGGEALGAIGARPFDVVLLDVKMPGVSGFEVFREIRRLRPQLPIVLLTGHGSRQDAEEGQRAGAYGYLMKPIDIESLLAVLRAAAGGDASVNP
jgi:two-component system OmpR family response regulator